MSNNSKYIITNLSNSLGQRNRVGGNSGSQAGVMPFLLSQPGVISLRDTNLPYVSGEKTSLDLFDWRVISSSGDSGGGGASYISPLFYMDYETSSSTEVNGFGTLSSFTGTLTSQNSNLRPYPRFDNSNPKSGSYSLNFRDTGLSNSGYSVLNLGAPGNLSAMSFTSGSFSMATWIRPQAISQYGGIFNVVGFPYTGGYSFMLVMGPNTGSSGPLGWYKSNTTNGWNWFPVQPDGNQALHPNTWSHIVYTISGSTDNASRAVKTYINGVSLGAAPSVFSRVYDEDHSAFFGNWYVGSTSYPLHGELDETSLWDFTLTDDQVVALYNEGAGASALTALTQSS